MKNEIVERIGLLLEHYKIDFDTFEKKIGMGHANFRMALKNDRPILAAWLPDIFKLFPECNSQWLLTGEGNMLKNASDGPKTHIELECKNNPEFVHLLIDIIMEKDKQIELIRKKLYESNL